MTAVPPRHPSGVRMAGDDYQHLVTWNEVLLALRPDSGAETVTVEAPDAGNLDDVVVAYRARRAKNVQVKHAVNALTPVGTAYLTEPHGRTSLLQRFHRSWNLLQRGGQRPELRLVTDREIDPTDEAMRCLDRHSELLVPEMAGLRAGAARDAWARHLGVDEDALLDFLADLRFMTGRPFAAEAERADSLMWALGLATGQSALDSALGFVRDWVQRRERTLSIEKLREEVFERVGQAADRGALLIIEGVDDDDHPEDADVLVRYVERYAEDDPNLRRRLADPSDWQLVAQQLEETAVELRARGRHRVMVRGALRLPVWFAAGAALRHVRGFTVAALQHGSIWASDTAGATAGMVGSTVSAPGLGSELAVAVGVATDPGLGVGPFVERSGLPVGRIAVICPRQGPSNEAIPDSATAAAMAIAIRDEVRRLLEDDPADRIHLFLAAPGGLGLLLGHRWNALRPTSVYEHLGAGRGYELVLDVQS